ncbi:hypothetical protein [Vibrio maerlii]|uniref:hypothetical protein n=1 Tax=Vibrio maerlii TaxID=2231648 RepID=UPI000F4D2F37|nr:hypothetical protein [Vibrio maerlii]
MKTVNEAEQLLSIWGASAQQVTTILSKSDALQTRINLLFSIHDCLQLLVRDEKERNGYMLKKHSGSYFDGRKPLEIIASGKLEDLQDVHMRTRNMVCI